MVLLWKRLANVADPLHLRLHECLVFFSLLIILSVFSFRIRFECLFFTFTFQKQRVEEKREHTHSTRERDRKREKERKDAIELEKLDCSKQ